MKKAVSMFLAAALAVGTFAGCGSSADTGSTGSAASTESGSTDSAADGSVFKIGGIGPTTGDAAPVAIYLLLAVMAIMMACTVAGKKRIR